MPDVSFLDWPFFEPRHRALAEKLEAWADANLAAVDHSPTIWSVDYLRYGDLDGFDEFETQPEFLLLVAIDGILILGEGFGVELGAHHSPAARRTRAAASSAGMVRTSPDRTSFKRR